MTDRPGFFLLLFPASATFWWFFEYLNRFVQNWHYTGAHYDALDYFLYATLSFSTVLPAVLGTRDLINTFSWVRPGSDNFKPFKFLHPKMSAISALTVSGIGLMCIGVWPDTLFSLLWISPFLLALDLAADHYCVTSDSDGRKAYSLGNDRRSLEPCDITCPGSPFLRLFLGNVEHLQFSKVEIQHPLRSPL